MVTENKYLNLLTKNTRLILIFLVLEFVLGMVVNLFAVSPDDPGYLTEPIYLKLTLPLHSILGLLILIWAVIVLVFAIKAGKTFKKFTVLGFIFVLVAFLGGMAAVMLKESQAEIASLTMSLGFIASFIFYGKLYLLLKK